MSCYCLSVLRMCLIFGFCDKIGLSERFSQIDSRDGVVNQAFLYFYQHKNELGGMTYTDSSHQSAGEGGLGWCSLW